MALSSVPASPPTVTLLFCHGAGFCREIWSPIVTRLLRSPLVRRHCAAGARVRVVAFDFPYHGANRDVSVAATLHVENTASPRVTHPAMHWSEWAIAAVLEQVHRLERQRETESDCIIGIGHSMGAAALWGVETQQPGTFAGLVLFEPTCLLNAFPVANVLADVIVGAILKRRAHWESLEEAKQDLPASRRFAQWHPEALRAFVEGAVVEVSPVNNAMDPTSKVALSCHPHIEAAIYSGELLRLSPQQVARVQCRVAFHYGEHTTLFYPHLRQHLVDEFPHLYTIGEPVPAATHTLVMEDPDAVVDRIVGTLAELSPFVASRQSRL